MKLNNAFQSTFAIAALTLAAASQAGQFEKIDTLKDGTNVYAYTGSMELEDAKTYKQILDRDRHSVIVINSPGGQFVAGLEMGQMTMERDSEVTLIVDMAYSAAGMWALADDKITFLAEESELGLHLPFRADAETGAEAKKEAQPSLDGEQMFIGYAMGHFLQERFGANAAFAIMNDLAKIRDEFGTQGFLVFNGKQEVGIRK